MTRRAVRLTADHLEELPDVVSTRLRWKVDAVTLARIPADVRAAAVTDWVSEVLLEWGSCGRVVLWDDRPVGVVVYAPASFLPGLAELPTAPPSPDAVVLADLHVVADARGGGVGRMLVQSAARDLVPREVRALEAFATHHPPRREPSAGDGVTLPADFLGAVGFRTHRTHSTTPRMRMELRATRTWMNEVEWALERLVGAVRPGMKPAAWPNGRSRAVRARTFRTRGGRLR